MDNEVYDYLSQRVDEGVSEDLLLEIVGKFMSEEGRESEFIHFLEGQLHGGD